MSKGARVLLKCLQRECLYVLTGSATTGCSKSTTISITPSNGDFVHLFLVRLVHVRKKCLVKSIPLVESKGYSELVGDLSF